MKPDEATIPDWQELVDEYRNKNNPIYPVAIRMENSQLSTARHFGAFTMNGHEYIVMNPWKSLRVVDGRALLGVEIKFHKWACQELKKREKQNKISDYAQTELAI